VSDTTSLNIINVKERVMIKVYSQLFVNQKMLPAFLSLGGLTDEALQFCQAQGIATAYRIEQF